MHRHSPEQVLLVFIDTAHIVYGKVYVTVRYLSACHFVGLQLWARLAGDIDREQKCVKNYDIWHSKFILWTAISILVISNHNSFDVLFDIIASV